MLFLIPKNTINSRIYYYSAVLQVFLLLQDAVKKHTDLLTFSQNHFTELHLFMSPLHQVA